MRAITLNQAKKLTHGTILYHRTIKNTDNKTPSRLRVTGGVKTWKRDKTRIAVPLKHGLYEYGYLTNGTQEGKGFIVDLKDVSLAEN